MSLQARRLVIRGLVQGVGFRYAMVEAARAAGATGWVSNRRDGCVEALVQGSPEAVARMLDWARAGPPHARVAGVDAAEVPADPALRAFEIRRRG